MSRDAMRCHVMCAHGMSCHLLCPAMGWNVMRIKSSSHTRRPYSSHLGDVFSMERYNISRSGYLPKFHEVVCLPQKVTLQLHQVSPLPRKIFLMIDPLTYETSFTMRRATGLIRQDHQILRLARKMILMIDPCLK